MLLEKDGRERPLNIVNTAVLFSMVVECTVWSQRESLHGDFRIQSIILAVFVVVLHLIVLAERKRYRLLRIGRFIYLTALAVFAALYWSFRLPAIVISVSIIIVGLQIVEPVTVGLLIAVWIVFVRLMAAYATPWGELSAIPSGAVTRMMVYLIVQLWVGFSMLSESWKRERGDSRLIESLRRAIGELESANISYNSFVQLAEFEAARLERNRITREIHDGVGYALTNLIMLSESVQDMVGTNQTDVIDRLSMIRNQAKLALNDTRRALSELRDAELEHVFGHRSVLHMIDVFRQAAGIETEVDLLTDPRILDDEQIFPAVYRFIQEALTNSFRHGQASKVVIRMSIVENILITIVSDNGLVDKNITEGLGITGMRERLGETGGELSYQISGGFSVTARIPLKSDILV